MNTFPQPTARGFLRNKVIEAAKALAHVKSDQRGEAQGDAIHVRATATRSDCA